MTAPALAAPPQRIVAVGDLHGDYAAWQNIARAAGVIDASGHWAGGKTVLVQMGDITDRWADSLKIVRSLQQLQREAPRNGGRVIVLLGNHEAMNLIGDNRYTTAGEYAAFADAQSAARRDRVYEANRAALEAAARAVDPKATAEQVRAAWLAEHPLGWVEHRLAWSPSGELGKWAARSPLHDPTLPMSHVAVMMSLQTLFSPERAGGLVARVGFRFGDISYVASLLPDRLAIERREIEHCDVTFTGPPNDLAAVIHGGAPLEMVDVEGDMELAKRFVTLFPLPPKVA